ncbi:MAG: hypothetical protein Q9216_001936 [Gyalolechia sp. 2 TL-2023]
MQSKWIPLLSCTLDSAARAWSIYVPAGSWCELISKIEPSREESDCYEVLAGLTNVDKKTYVQSSFILPSVTPKHPMSKYIIRWDAAVESYKISLRRSTSSGQLAWKTHTRDDAHSEIPQAVTSRSSQKPSSASEPAICIDVSSVPLEAAARAKEKEEPAAIDHADRVSPSDINGPIPEEALPVLSPNPASETSSAGSSSISTTAQESNSDSETKDLPKLPVKVYESLVPDTPTGTQINADGSFLDSPVKPCELSRLCAPTPNRAHGLQFNPDDSLLDSPVKACNIVRPGAPTPGRARTRYMRDSMSEEGELSMVPEKSDVDDVFGVAEASFTCQDDSSKQLPPLNRTHLTLSRSNDALDIGISNTIAATHSHIDWLGLALKADSEYSSRYHPISSQKPTREMLQEAFKVVDSSNIQPDNVPVINDQTSYSSVDNSRQAMHIDLDAIFGGQGATDLEDDEAIEDSQSMAFVQVASQIKFEEILLGTHDEPEESDMTVARPRVGCHFNCLGNEILLPSSTPPIVSLFVQVAANRKAYRLPWGREGVMLAQANRYIDAVVYIGYLNFNGLQTLRGSSFEDRSNGHAVKVNDSQGSFGDQFNDESIIMDVERIFDHHVVRDRESNLQRPYLFDYEEHLYTRPKITCVNFRVPTTYFTKWDPEGFVRHWVKNPKPGPSTAFSKLWIIESVDDQPTDDACSTLEAESPNEKGESFALVEEEEENVAAPCHIEDLGADQQYPTASVPPQDNVSTAEPAAEAVSDPANSRDTESTPDECLKSAVEDEEYSPLDPYIPGLQAAHEDWHPEEMPDVEALRHIDDLLERAFGNLDVSAMEGEDNTKASVEISADSHHTLKSSLAEVDEYYHANEDEGQHQSGDSSEKEDSDEEKQRSSRATTPPSPITSNASPLSFSPISVAYNCAPCVVTKVITEPITPKAIDHPAEEGLSRYASTYAAIVISAGIVLSFW